MSITVVNEHGHVRILRVDGNLPPDLPVQLFTRDEILAQPALSPLEHLQLASIFSETDEDWGALLDPLVVSEDEAGTTGPGRR